MTNFRIGSGFDVHQLQEGEELILGGVKISHTKGTVAHSDGDVLIHAICDALLGALALGDIGKHFPDTSAQYKGIDSTILLKKCCQLIAEKGYQISNLDTTLVLEKPKIKDHVRQMCQTLANVMNIATDAVSIKATTNEKMGFIGRQEGVVAYASVLVYKPE